LLNVANNGFCICRAIEILNLDMSFKPRINYDRRFIASAMTEHESIR